MIWWIVKKTKEGLLVIGYTIGPTPQKGLSNQSLFIGTDLKAVLVIAQAQRKIFCPYVVASTHTTNLGPVEPLKGQGVKFTLDIRVPFHLLVELS